MNSMEYMVITETSDLHGNSLRTLATFPKSREGLNAAYEYANESGSLWEIFCGDELVDTLGDAMQRAFISDEEAAAMEAAAL